MFLGEENTTFLGGALMGDAILMSAYMGCKVLQYANQSGYRSRIGGDDLG